MKTTQKKKFPSKPELLPEIEKFVSEILRQTNLPEAKITNIEIALAEATSNSISHGNKANEKKFVEVAVTVNETSVTISIKDEGKGFSVKSVPDPTDKQNILKGSGRGLYIMKSLVDKLEYNFTDSGTETVLTINI